MLEFYPPAPGSFNRQGEPGQPLPTATVPPMPFRPTSDNNNAGKEKLYLIYVYKIYIFYTDL